MYMDVLLGHPVEWVRCIKWLQCNDNISEEFRCSGNRKMECYVWRPLQWSEISKMECIWPCFVFTGKIQASWGKNYLATHVCEIYIAVSPLRWVFTWKSYLISRRGIPNSFTLNYFIPGEAACILVCCLFTFSVGTVSRDSEPTFSLFPLWSLSSVFLMRNSVVHWGV